MNPSEQYGERSATAAQLASAESMAQSGDYPAALNAIKQVKQVEPRNVYILAFERQIEQLIELTALKVLTEDQRADILDSIPGIIERAIASPNAEPTAARAAELQREKEEKTAALQWLKDQYFQHAHDYVSKEQYSHALAEIRRVFIIDPENKTARDFEHHIEELAALQAIRIATQHTPGGSMPATASTQAPSTEASDTESALQKQERKARLWKLIAAVIGVVILAAAIWLVATHRPPETQTVTPSSGATVHQDSSAASKTPGGK